jgi:beta-ribofuranosylaminobenzene 5'-phosphate synthase
MSTLPKTKNGSDAADADRGIELLSGCRIHFGLMELAEGAEHQFAGLGVMLDLPRLHLRVTPCQDPSRNQPEDRVNFAVSQQVGTQLTPGASSIQEYYCRIADWHCRLPPLCSIELIEAYPFHCGLGTGTQLACILATAARLVQTRSSLGQAWQSVGGLLTELNPRVLADWSLRGQRSAIGLQGFLSGGLVLDAGIDCGSSANSGWRTHSYKMPASWRFLLIRPVDSSGIAGHREAKLLSRISSRPNPACSRMWQLANQACQSARDNNFSGFVDGLESYLEEAGRLFAPVQGGRQYNGTYCENAVRLARELGLRAVGQSSWGPTIFGISSDPKHALEVAGELSRRRPEWDVQIAGASVDGATARDATETL